MRAAMLQMHPVNLTSDYCDHVSGATKCWEVERGANDLEIGLTKMVSGIPVENQTETGNLISSDDLISPIIT